jgi:zinc transport system substrate-binding protein
VLNRLALVLSLLLLIAACAGEPAAGDAAAPDAPADEAAVDDAGDEQEIPAAEPGGGLTAVTTVFPLADMAQQIAPEAEVTLLTSSGQDPHDLELSPGDRALLESADVVLYMGDIDFQPQVEQAVGDATGEVVDASAITGADSWLGFDGHTHDDDDAHDDDGHAHDDDDAHAHDDDDAHDDDVDPHMWFDAGIMAEVAHEIGTAFAAASPDEAEAFRERAEALHDELLALDEELDEVLSDCEREVAIVSHEAYAYMLDPRGLEQEGISGAGGHGDASPQRLAELTQRIQEEDLPAVLAEPVEGRADAEALANEAGVDLLEIDPLEIGTDELFEQGYPDALREQAATFAEALECRG